MTWTPPTTLPPVEEWLTHDRIQCLDCGRWFRALGQHLNKSHGLTAAEYRRRWGMRQRQPLTCGDVSEERRQIAVDTGGPDRLRKLSPQVIDQAHAAAWTREYRPQEREVTIARMQQARLDRAAERRARITGRIAERHGLEFAAWARREYIDRGRTIRGLAMAEGVSETMMRKLLSEAGIRFRKTGPR